MPTFSERKESTIKADPVQLRPQVASPAGQANGAWGTIRSFILWSHERGTVQYDVMVTLILLFVFFSPRLINFNDRPVQRNPPGTGVVVNFLPDGGLVYQVDAKAIPGKDDASVRAQLLRVIEPVSGSVSISRYESVTDKKGKVIAYKVWAIRQ
jgi:hypothetical protein